MIGSMHEQQQGDIILNGSVPDNVTTSWLVAAGWSPDTTGTLTKNVSRRFRLCTEPLWPSRTKIL